MVERALKTPVLLVEDNDAVRRMLRVVLRGGDFDVTAVATGAEALAHLAERPVGAVLLDLDLPDGRSADVLRWLHANDEQPPWLVISAMDRREAVQMDQSIGARFLAKPFDPWVLVDSIRAMTQQTWGQGNGGVW